MKIKNIKNIFINKIKSLKIEKRKNNFKKVKVSKKINAGYFYIVVGKQHSLEALISIKTLSNKTKKPIAVITDFPELYLDIKNVKFIYKIQKNHIRPKVDYINFSPFNKTIYLDSDTAILESIDDIFQLIGKNDLVLTFCLSRKRKLIANKIREYKIIPESLSEANTGVIGFLKNSNTKKFFNTWRNKFYKYNRETSGYDQPSFRIALWKHGLKKTYLPHEYNMRSIENINKSIKLKNVYYENYLKPKILHGHNRKNKNYLQLLKNYKKYVTTLKTKYKKIKIHY